MVVLLHRTVGEDQGLFDLGFNCSLSHVVRIPLLTPHSTLCYAQDSMAEARKIFGHGHDTRSSLWLIEEAEDAGKVCLRVVNSKKETVGLTFRSQEAHDFMAALKLFLSGGTQPDQKVGFGMGFGAGRWNAVDVSSDRGVLGIQLLAYRQFVTLFLSPIQAEGVMGALTKALKDCACE